MKTKNLINTIQIKCLFCNIWDKVSRRFIWLYLDLSIHQWGQEFMVLSDNHRLLANKQYLGKWGLGWWTSSGSRCLLVSFQYLYSKYQKNFHQRTINKYICMTIYDESCSILLHKGDQVNSMDNSRKQSIQRLYLLINFSTFERPFM